MALLCLFAEFAVICLFVGALELGLKNFLIDLLFVLMWLDDLNFGLREFL